jgi:hypothetical protein
MRATTWTLRQLGSPEPKRAVELMLPGGSIVALLV